MSLVNRLWYRNVPLGERPTQLMTDRHGAGCLFATGRRRATGYYSVAGRRRDGSAAATSGTRGAYRTAAFYKR